MKFNVQFLKNIKRVTFFTLYLVKRI